MSFQPSFSTMCASHLFCAAFGGSSMPFRRLKHVDRRAVKEVARQRIAQELRTNCAACAHLLDVAIDAVLLGGLLLVLHRQQRLHVVAQRLVLLEERRRCRRPKR